MSDSSLGVSLPQTGVLRARRHDALATGNGRTGASEAASVSDAATASDGASASRSRFLGGWAQTGSVWLSTSSMTSVASSRTGLGILPDAGPATKRVGERRRLCGDPSSETRTLSVASARSAANATDRLRFRADGAGGSPRRRGVAADCAKTTLIGGRRTLISFF